MLQKRVFLVILLLGLNLLIAQSITAQGIPVLFPEPLSPRIANYNIDVRLDTEKRMLEGQELLIWYNKTPDTINELQFHVYLNAFRNSKSTFMIESGGGHRGYKIKKDGWGFTEVDRITLAYGQDFINSIQYIHPKDAHEVMGYSEDLTDHMEFIQPDNDNENDKSVFRLPLPKPLPPGEVVAVNIDFTAKLPTPPFSRTGAKEEYFFVGQWFPKIGVYNDGAWNTHQFHLNSEFFADFGIYNVRITVPEENIVGATGIEVCVQKNDDGTATHFYHAEDVHDFAWTTSPEFVEFTGKAQDVDIRVLLQPEHAYQGQRHLDAAKVAIEHFQDWYGDYPFPNLTVVDPRRGAMGSGGMEYPTLITVGFGTAYGLPEGIRLFEMVLIHEFGHNFWYHLLASNEFEESWMDEGINTYTEIQIMSDAYGPVGDMIDFLGIKINDRQLQRGQYINFADFDPIIRKAWEFYSGTSYGVNSFAKPGIVLTTLQNYLGMDLMKKIMRTYVERWRFKHPTSQDFFDVAIEVSGQDLNWFFEQAFYSRAEIDYSVDDVFTREVKEGKGYDFTLSTSEEDTSMTDGEVEETESDEEEVALVESASGDSASSETETADSLEAKKKPKMYYSGVNVRRLGEFTFPVEIEVVFANGDSIRENWDGQEMWKKFRYTKPTRLVAATVDPDWKIPMDVNFTNNSRTVEKQRLGVNKLSARWMFWTQFLLDQPEFLNLFALINDLL